MRNLVANVLVASLMVAGFAALTRAGDGEKANPAEPGGPWTIQTATVVAKEPVDKGTLITVRLLLNDPHGAKGRTYVTCQSPFVISSDGSPLLWSGWMDRSPKDNSPCLWRPTIAKSVEIEITSARITNRRAIKETQISAKKVESERTIRYVDDNTAEVSLFFETKPDDVKAVGVILFGADCAPEIRDKGVELAEIKTWADKELKTAAPTTKPAVELSVTPTAARIARICARYSSLKNLPKMDLPQWRMSQFSGFSEKCVEWKQPEGTETLEVTLIFDNKGNKDYELSINTENIGIECSDKSIKPWEILLGNVYGDYDALAKKLDLSDDPPTGPNQTKCDFGGKFNCTLKPGQQMYTAFVFCVPKGFTEGKLKCGSPSLGDIDVKLNK